MFPPVRLYPYQSLYMCMFGINNKQQCIRGAHLDKCQVWIRVLHVVSLAWIRVQHVMSLRGKDYATKNIYPTKKLDLLVPGRLIWMLVSGRCPNREGASG